MVDNCSVKVNCVKDGMGKSARGMEMGVNVGIEQATCTRANVKAETKIDKKRMDKSMVLSLLDEKKEEQERNS